MKKPYSQVNPPPKRRIECLDESRTRQSEKDSCDVNRLMAKYEKTGVMPMDMRPVIYADVSEVGDYRAVVTRVRNVELAFMQLPAKVRATFDNDAAAFLDFASDPSNEAELIELGVLHSSQEGAPETVPAPEVPEGTPSD